MENLNRNLELIKQAQNKAISEYLTANPDKTIQDIYIQSQWEDEVEFTFIPEVTQLINKYFIELYEQPKTDS